MAYSLADPVSKVPTAAGRAVAQALAAAHAGQAARMVLPVLLASSRAPVVTDFSQGAQVSGRAGGRGGGMLCPIAAW